MDQFISFFKITGPWALGIVGVWVVLQLIGEIIELKGKIVPEFFKVRKFFKRRRDEKKYQKKLLEDVKTILIDFNSHYSEDNITKRNEWMEWVNERAKIYDESVQDLKDLHKSIADNNALTLDLYININRNRIIDFASKVTNENLLISREEFNRIFKTHKEYEEVLQKHNMTNGEVDIAYRVIVDAYKERMKEHNFLEDVRGYEKK